MVLYKYRGNSDFTNQIFMNQKVWLSNASGLNDPFECSLQDIAKEWIEIQDKKGKQAHLAGFLMEAMNCVKHKQLFFNMKPAQVQSMLDVYKKKSSLTEKYQKYREFIKKKTGHYPTDILSTISEFDKQLNEVGIFSLSETAVNQLMWSHYAEESRGIAIGFAVEKNTKLSDANHCLRVNYSDVLPSFSGNGFIAHASFYFDEYGRPYAKQKISFNDPTFRLAISTKPTCWAYEKEWRYVEEKSGTYCLPGQIKEIVFGLRCTLENREKYKSLTEKYIVNPVSFSEIRKVPNSNKIVKVAL